MRASTRLGNALSGCLTSIQSSMAAGEAGEQDIGLVLLASPRPKTSRLSAWSEGEQAHHHPLSVSEGCRARGCGHARGRGRRLSAETL
jgi:hypothetical protein